MPDDMTALEYVLLGRSPYVGYFSSPTRHDRAMVADVLERLDLTPLRRPPSRHAERRRAPAPGDRPGAGPGGADPAARRADERARHRPPAAGARARRPAAPRPRTDGRVGDARPHAGRPVQRPAGAAPRGPVRRHRRRRRDVLRAETLAEFYGVRVTVHHEPDGTVVVIPRRDRRRHLRAGHFRLPTQSARLEHEDRDHPLGLRLVVGVVRPGGDGALPPLGPLVAGDLAGDHVLVDRPVTQFDVRVGDEVVVPDRVLRRPAERRDDGVATIVLDAHQRRLAQLAGLGAAARQQDRPACPSASSPRCRRTTRTARPASRAQSVGLGSYSPSSGMDATVPSSSGRFEPGVASEDAVGLRRPPGLAEVGVDRARVVERRLDDAPRPFDDVLRGRTGAANPRWRP